MAQMYDPTAFEGGQRGPVSGGVAGAGYLTTALTALDKGYKEKREREGTQIKDQLSFADQQLAQAEAGMKANSQNPEALAKFSKDYADAFKQREDLGNKLKKYYGAKDNVWSALWQKINSGGKGAAPPQAGGPPQPAGSSPGATGKSGTPPFAAKPAPAPAGAEAPPAAGAEKPPQNPNIYSTIANVQAAKAITEGKTEADLAEEAKLQRDNNIQKLKDDAVRQVDLKVAQQSYISTIRGVMTGEMGIDDAIKKVTETTATTFPDDSKAIPQHIIATVNGALRLPFYANQPEEVKRLNKILSDQYAVLAGESGKTYPKPLTLGKTERAAADRTPGYDPNVPLDQQSPEVQSAYHENITKMTAQEDKVEKAKLDEIIARAKHLGRIGVGTGHGGRAGAAKNPMDDVLMQINRGMNMAFKGAMDVEPDAAQAKAEEIAQQVVDGNAALLAQKYPEEKYIDFVYRMLGQGAGSPAAPPKPAADEVPLSKEDQDLANAYKYTPPAAP